jgi:hypothetical protein
MRCVLSLLEKLRCEAQSALDDLWTKELIPFELEARKIDSLGYDEYIIRFYDSRLPSVDVSWKNGDSFGDIVRAAVLVRVERIGPRPRQLKLSQPQVSRDS